MKRIIFGLISAVFIGSVFAQSTSFNPQQVQDIRKIVHDYLVQNPEVLIEVSQVLQERETAKQQQAALKAIGENKDLLFKDKGSPTIGAADGNPVIVEFFDYQCGHCKEMQPVIDALFKQNKNLKVILKELPIFGNDSQYAAQAALAAAKQGKYAVFHQALFKAPNPLTKDKIMQLAKSIGLDTKKLSSDMNSPEIKKQIRDNFQLAQKLKLVGTPAMVIANKDLTKFEFVPGTDTQENLQKLIQSVNSTAPKS